MMDNIEKLAKQLETARDAYRAKSEEMTVKQAGELGESIKALMEQLSRAIASGANPCPKCKALPIGMMQSTTVKRVQMRYFEVGCLACRDHRTQGMSREEAVLLWNEGKWES